MLEKERTHEIFHGGHAPDQSQAWEHRFSDIFVGFLLPLVPFIILLIFFSSFLVYVRPNEFGIKQVNIGPRAGIQQRVYGTGFHVIVPFGVQVMHRFPRDIQVFELTNFSESAARIARRVKAAHIQTSDGFFVDVDVSILFRIDDPYKVITTLGPGRLYEENGIIPKAEPKLKQALGEMTTEEFYNSPLRVKKALLAKQMLNEELSPKGIVVEQVLVRYFRYSDELQRNIEEKKLKDQLVFTNQSKARAASEEALVKKAKTEGEANVRVKLQEGQAYVMKKSAERDLYERTRHAEADLLVTLAEARKAELINAAYQLKGSDRLVGMKMAELLRGMELIILPVGGDKGMNPLDLDSSLNLFGVQGKE